MEMERVSENRIGRNCNATQHKKTRLDCYELLYSTLHYTYTLRTLVHIAKFIFFSKYPAITTPELASYGVNDSTDSTGGGGIEEERVDTDMGGVAIVVAVVVR